MQTCCQVRNQTLIFPANLKPKLWCQTLHLVDFYKMNFNLMGSFQHGNSIDFNHLVRTWGMGFISTGFSFFLLYLSQPPSGFPEAAYFFTLPLLIWFYFSPSKKVVLVVVFFGGFLYHAFLISWLRHVTFIGMLLASVILTLYNLPWFLLAYRSLRIAIDSSFLPIPISTSKSTI